MSATLTQIVCTLNGILVGFLAAGLPWWHQRRQVHRWRHLATHDDITGLPNRRAMLTALREATRRGHQVGFILLDLDHFKAINDQLGHETGNDVLHAVGDRLTSLPPPVRLAARLSGDEFAILTDADHVATCAHQAWQAICAHRIRLDTADVAVAASVGYTITRLGLTPRQILREADWAMYAAKSSGTAIANAATTDPDPTERGRCRDRRHPG